MIQFILCVAYFLTIKLVYSLPVVVWAFYSFLFAGFFLLTFKVKIRLLNSFLKFIFLITYLGWMISIFWQGGDVNVYLVKTFFQNFNALYDSIAVYIDSKAQFLALFALFASLLNVFPVLNKGRFARVIPFPVNPGAGYTGFICIGVSITLFFYAQFKKTIDQEKKNLKNSVATKSLEKYFPDLKYDVLSDSHYITSLQEKKTELKKQPDVVLFLIEALRRKNLKIYGYHRDTAPFLTEMSDRCIKFNKHSSNAPTSTNSLFSVLTSKLPISQNTGIVPNQIYALGWGGKNLKHNEFTDFLVEKGYEFSYLVSGDASFAAKDTLVKSLGFHNVFDWNIAPNDQRFNSWAIDDKVMLEKVRMKLLNKSKPQFMVVFLLGTHNPWELPPGHSYKFTQDSTRSGPMMDWYDSSIYYLDMLVKNFYAGLPSEKREETLFLFTGDHGESFGKEYGDHGIAGQRMFGIYNELIDVPLLMCTPEGINAEVNYVTSHISLAPLIASYMVNSSKEFKDKLIGFKFSFLNKDHHVYSNPYTDMTLSIRYKEFKMIKSLGGSRGVEKSYVKLFNLETDPAEQVDLYGKIWTSKYLEEAVDSLMVYYPKTVLKLKKP